MILEVQQTCRLAHPRREQTRICCRTGDALHAQLNHLKLSLCMVASSKAFVP